MGVPHLELLAGSLRGFLEQRGSSDAQGRVLDLIAVLSGLHNWPEVIAFPARLPPARSMQQQQAASYSGWPTVTNWKSALKSCFEHFALLLATLRSESPRYG